MNKIDVSVIIPAYNEEKTVEKVIATLCATLSSSPYSFQLVIVDDGSKDQTQNLAQIALKKYCPHSEFSRLITKENGGKGSAIRAGIHFVQGKYTIIQDADLEYDPRDILKMIDYAEKNHLDVLYGSRFLNKANRHSYTSFYWGGRIVSFITNLLYGQHLTDEPTCYKMFLSSLLQSINLKCTGFEFCPEVTAKVAKKGYKIKEIPISYFPRTVEEGKKISWKDGVEAIAVLLKYRFQK